MPPVLALPYRHADDLTPLLGPFVVPPPPDPVDPDPSEITTGTISASASHDEHTPDKAVDDDLASYWTAEGDGQTLTRDLGSVVTVGSVGLGFYRGDERTHTFDIETSEDGTAWVKMLDRATSALTLDVQHFGFPDVQARFVRFVGHRNSINGWNSVSEFRVFGADETTDGSPGAPVMNPPVMGDAQAQLSWRAAFGAPSDTFTLLRALGSAGAFEEVAFDWPETSFLDSPLVNGRLYRWMARAHNAAGDSADSNIVSGTPVAVVEEPPPDPDPDPEPGTNLSLGLFHSQAELDEWVKRASGDGPFYGAGDFGGDSNSPFGWTGDSESITSEAGKFSSSADVWDGDMSEDGDSLAVRPYAHHAICRAFRSLVNGSESDADGVLTYLNRQWTSNGAWDRIDAKPISANGTTAFSTEPWMDLSPLFTMHAISFDWTREYASATQIANALEFFSEVLEWWDRKADDQLNKKFETRSNLTNFNLVSSTGTNPDREMWDGGPKENQIGGYAFNNRFATNLRLMAVLAILLDDSAKKFKVKRYFYEAIRFCIYPFDALTDFYREFTTSSHIEQGLRYSCNMLGHLTVIADVFARSGDTSLYDLVTTGGSGGSAGTPSGWPGKSLEYAWTIPLRYLQEEHMDRRGQDNEPLEGIAADGREWLETGFAAQAQRYYKNPDIKKLVERSGTHQASRFPSRYRKNGASSPFWGEQGVWPNVYFMFGAMDHIPYPVAVAA